MDQKVHLQEQIKDLKENIQMVERLMKANPDADHKSNKESVRIWNLALKQVEAQLVKLDKPKKKDAGK